MPELPEVETVRTSLAPLIVGKQIQQVGSDWPKILINGRAAFQRALIGATVTGIDRRGKYLLLRFSNDQTVVSHLRMEGKYELVANSRLPKDKFVHVWFTFTDGTQLRYRDMRKFGRMQLVTTGTENQVVPGLAKMGPEPTAATFTVPDFQARLKRHHKPIKSVILDQSVVAGVGNIYADETLWLAKIHPETPANSLSLAEVTALHDAIITELAEAIKAGGTSAHTYVDAQGNRGSFQDHLHVYDREGTPCDRCGTLIEKIKVGQRGTHFCPFCQKVHA